MNAEEQQSIPGALADSFESILDTACSRLFDRKVRYSLRRIRELEEILEKLEQDLDEILLLNGRARSSPRTPVPSGVIS
ncbi:MAG: hypothetical protein LBL56_02220 [Treponema sp.]|jgi:hypothetical protein|nr:hypothetical protein [Treponema sp.]